MYKRQRASGIDWDATCGFSVKSTGIQPVSKISNSYRKCSDQYRHQYQSQKLTQAQANTNMQSVNTIGDLMR